jgi:hypothetical protein
MMAALTVQAAPVPMLPLRLAGEARMIRTGAARFGRRTVRPHAHPAAPLPLSHEASRHEAAMTSDTPAKLATWLPLRETCFAFGDPDWRNELRSIMWRTSAAGTSQAYAERPRWEAAHRACGQWLRGEIGSGRLELLVSGSGATAPDIHGLAAWADDISLEAYGWHLRRNDARLRNPRLRRVAWMPWPHAVFAFAPPARIKNYGESLDDRMTYRFGFPGGLEDALLEKLAAGQLIAQGTPVRPVRRGLFNYSPPPNVGFYMDDDGLRQAAYEAEHMERAIARSQKLRPGPPAGPAVQLKPEWWTPDRYDSGSGILKADGRWFGELMVCEAGPAAPAPSEGAGAAPSVAAKAAEDASDTRKPIGRPPTRLSRMR